MGIEEIEALIAKHGSVTAQPLMDLIVTVVLEAVAAEREACARVCDEYDDDGGAGEAWASRFAAAVRARSNHA